LFLLNLLIGMNYKRPRYNWHA